MQKNLISEKQGTNQVRQNKCVDISSIGEREGRVVATQYGKLRRTARQKIGLRRMRCVPKLKSLMHENSKNEKKGESLERM